MKKNFAITVAVLLTLLVLWGVFFENSAAVIYINGQQIEGPLKGIFGAGGLAVAFIALFSLAILLALAFAGTSFIILGCMLVAAGIFLAFTLPFLFPLLIPLVVIWVFVALMRKK